MAISSIQSAFLYQAKACADLDSPFMSRICTLIADRLPKEGRVWEKILSWDGDVSPSGDSVPLRLAGALHGIVLEKRDDTLIAVYPPNHIQCSDDQIWSAIHSAVDSHADFILERLKSAPQTNEVRRAGVLLPGLLEISRLTGCLDFVMSELGASAGLNMFWDKYFYQFGQERWGPKEASTQLAPSVTGRLPKIADLNVLSRFGCDLKPVDLSGEDHQKRLMSYIWPDQEDRLERTLSAIEVAVQNKVLVEEADAVDWLKTRLEHPYPGSVHVIYHTIAWQYFSKNKRDEGERLMQKAGAEATTEAPLAWLRLEADGQSPGAALTLTLWPSGETRLLARGDFHGRWVKWLDS